MSSSELSEFSELLENHLVREQHHLAISVGGPATHFHLGGEK
jgi:hypothetical protein